MNRNRTTSKLRALINLGKEESYLRQVGWFASFYSHASIDSRFRPIPWLTYPATAFIGDRLREEMELFEYGSGNSTIWWASKVGNVVSCEHDEIWYTKMKPDLPANVEYVHALLDQGYAEVIDQFTGRFDVVVIDGRDRVACAQNSVNALKPNGVIIWDNTDRERYQPGFDLLREHNFRRIDFHGIGPIWTIPSCTSIFYRDANCFGI